jgi:hypothetical protein
MINTTQDFVNTLFVEEAWNPVLLPRSPLRADFSWVKRAKYPQFMKNSIKSQSPANIYD